MKFSELKWEATSLSRKYSQWLTTDGTNMCRVVHREHSGTYMVAYIEGFDANKTMQMTSKEVDIFQLCFLLFDLHPLPNEVTTT